MNEEISDEMPAGMMRDGMGYPGREDTASIIERIDPYVIAERLRHLLLGEKFNEKMQQWVKIPERKPYINAEGAARISSMFASLVNNNISMSNLNDRDISNIIIDFGDDLINHITFKFSDYGVNITDAQPIVNMITNNAFGCLKRALKEGERRFLRTSFKTQEIIKSSDDDKKKRSLLWRL